MKRLLVTVALAALAFGGVRAQSAAGSSRRWVLAQRGGDAGGGFLDVSSEPPGAQILIDDGDTGQTTPQHHLSVTTGHHRLTLVTAERAHKLTIGFTVEAGQTKRLTLYLAK